MSEFIAGDVVQVKKEHRSLPKLFDIVGKRLVIHKCMVYNRLLSFGPCFGNYDKKYFELTRG